MNIGGINKEAAVMDFEGISWPGNIYQKFEAMCLEVEEVMYQDTVKYLENQVQTVGSSVKKFYSEVMQDIRPSDFVGPVDPVKVAAAELPLNPYSHTEVIKKPKVTMKRDLQIVKKKVEDPSDFVDPVKLAAAELPLNPYSHTEVIKKPKVTMKRDLKIVKKKVEDSSGFVDPVKVAAAELPLSPYSHTEVIKKPKVTMKRDLQIVKKKIEDYKVAGDINAELKEAVAELDGAIHHAKGDIGMRAFSNSYSVNNRGAGLYSPHSVNKKENNKVSSPSKVSKETNLAPEILNKSTSFCQLTSESEAGSDSDKGCDAKEARSVDNSVCTSSARVDSPPSVNLSSDIEESNLENFPETSDTDLDNEKPACMESKTDTIYGSVPEEAAVISSEGSTHAASNDIGLEIIERLDESTFEDTCVLVEGNELEVVSQKKGKLKSYKKKLREAFPLRMKSTRKREYEKLAAQYSAHSSKWEGIEQHSEDKPDSEWELL